MGSGSVAVRVCWKVIKPPRYACGQNAATQTRTVLTDDRRQVLIGERPGVGIAEHRPAAAGLTVGPVAAGVLAWGRAAAACDGDQQPQAAEPEIIRVLAGLREVRPERWAPRPESRAAGKHACRRS